MLALGGASWPRLGSDAAWAEILRAQGIAIAPLRPANCGFLVAWSEPFRRFEGQPLKRIAIAHGDQSVRGEAMITRDGLEGGAIYALSAPLRDAIDKAGETTIAIDLMPDITPRRAGQTARGAARQAVVVEFPAQGDAAGAGGHRPLARSGGAVAEHT